MAEQLTLFPVPPKPTPRAATPPFSDWAPFDDWDLARMVPDPDAVISEELALPTDNPEWMPKGRFG